MSEQIKSRIWFIESGALKSVSETVEPVTCTEAFLRVVDDAKPENLGAIASAHTEAYCDDLNEEQQGQIRYFLVPQLLAKAGKLEGGMKSADESVERLIDEEFSDDAGADR